MYKRQHNMKTVQKIRSRGESCSCISCTNKSDYENPSLRRIIDLGSRIDRLYFGNYIPLREQKLLKRLVRTRAVYDDIRAQLVSDSTVSSRTMLDFNPRNKVSLEGLDDVERSGGAVLELINIVDKGAIGSKKLGNCCSCCSCSPSIKRNERYLKRHRPDRRYAGVNGYEARERIRAFKERRDSSRNKRVRFKTKHIRSDPCTCTFKLFKKHSKTFLNRLHPRPSLLDLQPTINEELKHKSRRISDIARSSYQNLLQSKGRMKELISEEIISKIRNSQTRMREKIELQTKNSLERFNQAKDKFTSKVRAGAKKMKKIKEKSKSQLFSGKDIAAHFIKDSISKLKEDRIRKQIMKDWECDPECIEDTCIPDECYLKLKRLNRKNYPAGNKGINYRIRTQEQKAGEPLRHTKAQKSATARDIETKKAQKTQQLKETRSRGTEHKRIIQDDAKENTTSMLNIATQPPETLSVSNLKASYLSNNVKFENSLEKNLSHRNEFQNGPSINVKPLKNKPKLELAGEDSPIYTDSYQYTGLEYRYNKPVNEKRMKKRRNHRQQGSQTELGKILIDSETGHALKRCFCTLKLKSKVKKSKIKRPVTRKIMTNEKSTINSTLNLKNVQTHMDHNGKKPKILLTKSKLLPYECEPGFCLPGECDPYRCIQFIKLREATLSSRFTTRKTKSTFSFTSRSYKPAKAKIVQSVLTHRRDASKPSHKWVVQKKRQSELENYPVLKQEVKLKDRGLGQGNVHRKTPTQIIKQERNSRIGTTLKRCFCTLKLQKNEILKRYKMKIFTTNTQKARQGLQPIDTANKSTKTKEKYSRPLSSFECEPFTCIPGECDPLVCLERLNRRTIPLREVGLNTSRPKTISSSSINAYPKKSIRSVQVQNKSGYKRRKVLAKTPKAKHIEEKHLSKYYSPSATPRQVVKIGSTFSFNIYFYKNESKPSHELKLVYPTEKITKARRNNKGIKINKLNVAHVETNIQPPKRHDKGSIDSPLLKKCYCTVNLKKMWNNDNSEKENGRNGRFFYQFPRVYTVNRAMIGDKQVKRNRQIPFNSSFHRKYNKCQLNKTISKVKKKNYIKKSPNLQIRERIITKSNLQLNKNVKMYPQRRVGLENNQEIAHTDKYYRNILKSPPKHQICPTSLARYFQRCFCTMNLKVENNNFEGYVTPYNSEFSKRERRVLDKLKPYECEPGVCIPGECNPYECQKILLKRLMRKVSIKSGTENLSREISSSTSQTISKFKTPMQQTMIQTSTKPKVKNEISLNNNQKQVVRIGSNFSFNIEFSKKISTAQKNGPNHILDTRNLADRVKSSKSKGTNRIEKSHDFQSQSASMKTIDIGTFTDPMVKRCFCTLKLQKKGRLHKELHNQQRMRPPYDIKRRTMSRGQNTRKIKPLKMSYAIKPYECEPNICIPGKCDPYQCLKIIKKRNNYEVGTSPIYREVASVSSMTTSKQEEKSYRSTAIGVKPKKNTNLVKYGKKHSEFGYRNPLRQAVRVGSSFSFNIEFSKDSSPSPDRAQGQPKRKYARGPANENNHSIKHLKKHTHTYAQSNRNLVHTQSQIDQAARNASTFTNSFIKRCFCTAELYKKEKENAIIKSEKNRKSPSFFEKCTCLFKKMKLNTKLTSKNLNKKINSTIEDKSKLAQYICKPGICVPNKCDSYICGRVMRKYRNNKFKASTVDIIKTRPISVNNFTATSILSKENLSYNKSKRKNVGNRKKVRAFSRTFLPSNISHTSQVKKIKELDRGISKNSITKRCFCTLKLKELNKFNRRQNLNNEINFIRVNTKSVMTDVKGNLLSNTLLPYECEPGICIPYQCDPYKCLQVIQSRDKNHGSREFGVSTLSLDKYSSIKDTKKKHKSQSVTNKTFHQHVKQSPHKYSNIRKAGQSKQSVKIGSTFSFDIEFFKEKNLNGLDLQKLPLKGFYNNDVLKKQRENGNKKYMSNQTQINNKKINTNHTQFSNDMMITQSTMTAAFIPASTLEAYVNTETELFKTPMLNKSTATMKIPMYTHQLKPFECEPFFCIPGECDPFECAKRIKMRDEKYHKKDTLRPFLKRCLCTLKFQKSQESKIINTEYRPKPKQRQIYTENRRTALIQENMNIHHLSEFECEPFYCVPGYCDPEECMERIKMRDKKNKNFNTMTRSPLKSQKRVGIKQENIKFQKSHATITDELVPEILESPKLNNLSHKKAVTLGSNLSFNIEFYKEKIPQSALAEPIFDKKLKRRHKIVHNIDQNTNTTHLRSRETEFDRNKTQNRYTQKENILKRCFCTLNFNNKKHTMENVIPFPQTIKIGRVTVHHNANKLSKEDFVGPKPLATENNQRNSIKHKDFNPCTCIYSFWDGKPMPSSDLKTILPYMPEKFNKTVSKTVIPLQNHHNKQKKIMIANRGKRLTRKRDRKYVSSIPTAIQTKTTKNNRFPSIKKFIRFCAQILNHKSTSKNFPVIENTRNTALLDEITPWNNERHAMHQLMSNSKPKKSDKTCPFYANYIINLLYHNIDSKQGSPRRNIKPNKNLNSIPTPPNVILNKKQPNDKKTGHNMSKVKNIKVGQLTKEKRSPSLKVHFLNTTPKIRALNDNELTRSKNKPFIYNTKSDRAPSYNYCHPCRIKMNKEEFHKAAGDQLNQNRKKIEVCFGKQAKKPLFEMHLDSGNYDILNKDQVVHNFSKLNTKCKQKPIIEVQLDSKKFNILNKEAVFQEVLKSNTKSKKGVIGSIMNIVGLNREIACPCRPCVCASHSILGQAAEELGAQHFFKTSRKPCTCDSLVCAKNIPKTKTRQKRHKFKTCVCGSPVCHRDPERVKARKAAAKRLAKRRAKALKKANKARAIRLKEYSKSDKIRYKERQKLYKKLEKQIDRNAPAGVLLADNVLDIGKFGITATTDVLRQVGRFARDPKHRYQMIQSLENNPQLLQDMLLSTNHCSGLRATMRRVRLRCFAMKGMQKLKLKLESNPITRYLLHINSKDPRRRVMIKKPRKRAGERLDYTCNFYMATRRKRPFMSIYNRCPWFYPHFLSLVHAWKQLVDIGLFLLAAVVWSPCILCFELCRACMCCFLCNR